MEDRYLKRLMSFGSITDLALEFVMAYINDPRDRNSISLVCQRWYDIDSLTRKHIKISFCYSISPDRLCKRFPRLESLKLKGKPRAARFNLIPGDWGGYAEPWIKEISENFNCLKSIHFRRMIVKDTDLEVLGRSRGQILQVLKLDMCSGFSTDGLLHVTRSCRCLRTLVLEDSTIEEKDGEWLHELALNNTVLETLNFYSTDLGKISVKDLEMIARNCRSLVSIKISDCEILDLVNFFHAATALEEFGGGSFNVESDRYSVVSFPRRLCCLGLSYMGRNELPIIFPFASQLKKLDLLYALFNTEDHYQLIQRCPNLEVLETRNVIGDRGLELLSQSCKRLRRLIIELGADDEQGMEEEQAVVTQRGLSALAQGGLELEYLTVYVSDITNEPLESIGRFCKNLCDFRLILHDRGKRMTELPLDNGVRALLRGCQKLRRLSLYLCAGGLTDLGLRYVGQYSQNVRTLTLGNVGESDTGLLEVASGCPKLQKLEIRGCCFTERAFSLAVMQLTSLRYIWMQGCKISATPSDLLTMVRPFWNIEFSPPRQVVVTDEQGEKTVVNQPAQILAYYSLAGERTDYPDTVVPVNPSSFPRQKILLEKDGCVGFAWLPTLRALS
ncbi:Leucine-rich repeat [Macleaya cordata]|uniref:Leucine-rich repeat n=1 Tax=Macleaya cordata TaxID=56857 RepID=A0A200Q7K0_MACCD|nr:Leucine-rich repeat [Macleaya cordata]